MSHRANNMALGISWLEVGNKTSKSRSLFKYKYKDIIDVAMKVLFKYKYKDIIDVAMKVYPTTLSAAKLEQHTYKKLEHLEILCAKKLHKKNTH